MHTETKPLISIILPVYNGEKYLETAIKSVLDQSYDNLELIIINDASTDNSLQIAEDYKSRNSKIKIVTNEANQSLPVCLNIGHRLAKGDLLTWTSDDNFYQRDAIQVLYENLTERDVDVVYSNYLVIDEGGKIVGQSRLKPLEFLMFSGVVGACFLYKKEVFERNQGYSENLFLVEDYDFWLRALKHSRFYKIDNPGFYFYRYHPESLTSRMNTDLQLKKKFLTNLELLYQRLFKGMNLQDEEALISYIIRRYLEGAQGLAPVTKASILRDLSVVAGEFPDLSPNRLRKYVIEDAVESVLKIKEYQKLGNLIVLHHRAGTALLNLPINRYLALWKKCLF